MAYFFFWKFSSKCLSNTLCICKMTFLPPNYQESMQQSQGQMGFLAPKETINTLIILGLKQLIFFLCFLVIYLLLILGSFPEIYKGTLYYHVSNIYHLLKFSWETLKTFWLFRNFLYSFWIIFWLKSFISPRI